MMKHESSDLTLPSGAVLTAAQQRAFDQLAHYAVLHTVGLHKVAGIATRPYPLVIGPSGCGKTYLVQQLARSMGRPFFSLNLHNWIVRGAKNDQQITLDQLATFVRDHDEGVILIDEVNKLTSAHAGDSSWTASVLSEIIALIDMDERLDAMGLEGLRGKLRSGFLFIGAAAFQDEWNSARAASIGFAGNEASAFDLADFEKAVRAQKLVPDELLYRFNDRLIVLAPPTREEFARGIVAVRRELQLPALPTEQVQALAVAAQASGKMMRWLEAYAAECTRKADPRRLYEIGREQSEQESGASTEPAKSPAAAERARSKEYSGAYAIYGLRLEKLAAAAVETAAVLKEIMWVAERSGQPEVWRACRAVLRGAHEALCESKDVTSLHEWLRKLALNARRVCLPSTRDDEERGALAEEVTKCCQQISTWLWDLLGPLNRNVAGLRAMETIAKFLDAADTCSVEYTNLRNISSADLRTSKFDAEGDTRLRWLLPPGGS